MEEAVVSLWFELVTVVWLAVKPKRTRFSVAPAYVIIYCRTFGECKEAVSLPHNLREALGETN